MGRFLSENATPTPVPQRAPNRPVQQSPVVEREHARILAAYGGVYDDPKLQGMISKIVERLVAASERPDLSYRVTILNSPAINALAPVD